MLKVVSFLCFLTQCLAVPIAPLYNLGAQERVPGEWIVLLRRDTNTDLSATASDIAKVYGSQHAEVQVKKQFHFGKFRALRIATDDMTIHQIRHHREILLIEPNAFIRSASSSQDCKTQETGELIWGLSRIATHDAPNYDWATYDYMQGDGEGVDVYIVDSGINIHHEEFEGRAVWGMTAPELEAEGDDDLNGHGTHVAGTVGGKTYGVAKKAKLIAVKILSKYGDISGTIATLLEGIVWVVKDFQTKYEKLGRRPRAIINFSIGMGPGDISNVVDFLINEVIDQGLQIIIAAGNDASDACNTSYARVSSAVTVGATDIDDNLALFSNYGPCVDILAPGQDILSSYIGNTTATAKLQGTSMAAPHVTGMVARYLSRHTEGMSPYDIKAWLLKESSTNKISLDTYFEETISISTPNRLLYGSCKLGMKDEANPSSGGPSAAEVLTYIMFPLVIFMFAAVLVAACFKIAPLFKAKLNNADATAPYAQHQNENASTVDLSTVT